LIFAARPPKRLVVDQEHGNAVAARGSAADRTVTDKDVRELGVDLERDGSAIAFSARHGFVPPCFVPTQNATNGHTAAKGGSAGFGAAF
jgi:hypothetical protein